MSLMKQMFYHDFFLLPGLDDVSGMFLVSGKSYVLIFFQVPVISL